MNAATSSNHARVIGWDERTADGCVDAMFLRAGCELPAHVHASRAAGLACRRRAARGAVALVLLQVYISVQGPPASFHPRRLRLAGGPSAGAVGALLNSRRVKLPTSASTLTGQALRPTNEQDWATSAHLRPRGTSDGVGSAWDSRENGRTTRLGTRRGCGEQRSGPRRIPAPACRQRNRDGEGPASRRLPTRCEGQLRTRA